VCVCVCAKITGPPLSLSKENDFKQYFQYFVASILEIHRIENVGQSIFFARIEQKFQRENC
jgi:hypothetical protein